MAKKIQDPPGEVLLDRTYVPEQIRKDLSEPISFLEELADYGVQLLKRSFFAGERKTSDIVILPVLLRQVLAFLDAVHLHLLNGAVYTATPDLRAMFEATLSIEWILKGPPHRKESQAEWKERWARQYYVAELRQELFEQLHRIEDEYAVRYAQSITLYLTPTNGFGDEVVPRNTVGHKVDKVYSDGPYRSAAATGGAPGQGSPVACRRESPDRGAEIRAQGILRAGRQ